MEELWLHLHRVLSKYLRFMIEDASTYWHDVRRLRDIVAFMSRITLLNALEALCSGICKP